MYIICTGLILEIILENFILLFILSWKLFLTKLFLYHWKRKMVIYVLIYFGCDIFCFNFRAAFSLLAEVFQKITVYLP